MLAFAIIPHKYFFDVGGCIFDIFSMLINITKEKPQHNISLSNINPRENVFAFYTRPGVNDHILPPTITAADFVAKIVSKFDHFIVKCKHKRSISLRDKVEFFILQNIVHGSHPVYACILEAQILKLYWLAALAWLDIVQLFRITRPFGILYGIPLR
jgi:hypothetical protein